MGVFGPRSPARLGLSYVSAHARLRPAFSSRRVTALVRLHLLGLHELRVHHQIHVGLASAVVVLVFSSCVCLVRLVFEISLFLVSFLLDNCCDFVSYNSLTGVCCFFRVWSSNAGIVRNELVKSSCGSLESAVGACQSAVAASLLGCYPRLALNLFDTEGREL